MARQTLRQRPGNAANIFIRCLLSDAGALLGGLSDDEWAATLDYFGGACAYTGESLADKKVVKDHAIPLSKDHCGLHLYGNVLPTTDEVNSKKHDAHYRTFVTDPARLERIEAFFAKSSYYDRVKVFGDLRSYCQAQYATIVALCAVNAGYLERFVPKPADVDEAATDASAQAASSEARRALGASLPIDLDPADEERFKDQLLRHREAWIATHYVDGRRDVKRWNAGNFSPASSVMGNLRTRPQFRQGTWQRLGISRVVVSIRRPSA